MEGFFKEGVEKVKVNLLKDLQRELDAVLEAKDLDQAVPLRELIEDLQEGRLSGLLGAVQNGQSKSQKPKKQIPRNALKFKGPKYAIQNVPMLPNLVAHYAECLGDHLLRIESTEEWGFVRKWLSGKVI